MYYIPATKESVLAAVSQEQIFERYTGERVQFNHLFCSPLREDTHPTCGYSYSRSGSGILYLKDFSGHFWGNCFDLVMHMYGCSYGEALQLIAADFNISGAEVNLERVEELKKQPVKKEYSQIAINVRKFTAKDAEYWNSHGVTVKELKLFDVYPVQDVFLNGSLIYTYSERDPAYAYRFAEGEFKIYFPLRNKARFLTNSKRLQGYSQLPETGRLLVITKSYKDVMLLRRIGVYAVAPQSESTDIDPETMAELKRRFKRVVILYDFDYAGVKFANKLRKEYGLKFLFLTDGRFGTRNYGAKDVTDYYKKWGAKLFLALVQNTVKSWS